MSPISNTGDIAEFTTSEPLMSLQSRATLLNKTVARDVFGIPELYPPQLAVLNRLAMMKFKSFPLHPSSILFVHPTRGGISLVRDVRSLLIRGVPLMVVHVLSIGADLSAKVMQRASQRCGRIISIHLDEIQNITDAGRIIDSIKSLPNNTQKTVMIFASPQAQINKSHWKKFVDRLIEKKTAFHSS